ncbi:hypothetical protein [Hyphomonas jannaschiana]|uniref:hypothetical protein n=1 Tax=Hyphomonas jannaschiana TaxID=86 RepID=UPI0035C75A0E
MSNQMSQVELNRHIANVLNGKARFDDQHFEPVIQLLQKSEQGIKTVSMIWKIFAGLTILGIILLFVKMGNTSEMALRYSTKAHEEIGMWVLGIIVLGFLTILCVGMNNWAKGRIRKTKEKAIASLREKVAESDATRKATYESYLRQLGA